MIDQTPTSGPLQPSGGLFMPLRPGVPYTVQATPEGVFVALTDHADAEIGEWAIFRGWGTTLQKPPNRIVTSPDRAGLRFFANPQRIAGFLVYQRVTPVGDEVYTVGDVTPQDEAAAARA